MLQKLKLKLLPQQPVALMDLTSNLIGGKSYGY
jgi:hypothetical protein